MRLIANNLSFTYPKTDRAILRNLSCEIFPGKSTAIVGPSGSGKTTLMSLLGGLLEPQSGFFAAVDSDGRYYRPRDVSTWVLQTISLLPDRSVIENVQLGAYLDGATRTEAKARAEQVLTEVGLVDRSAEPAKVLSGGESQRVAIARALASTRPVLFADEPTGQLDSITTNEVLDAMFKSSRRTTILVTHDARAASRCDRVLYLSNGQLFGHPIDDEP